MTALPPTLEDLRDADVPAWLWDASRGRVVWANAAGVAAFDAATLFDLIDRPFDQREAGIERVAALGQSLARGAGVKAMLHFPSVGAVVPFACTCWLHTLADGRAGVLAVAEKPKPVLAAAPDALAGSVLSGLPMALLVMNGEGRFLHGNDAARALLQGVTAHTLSDLLQSDSRAAALLTRLQASQLVTSTEQAQGRDFKCTFSRSGADAIALMIEDVTARRALEQDILSKQIAALDAKVDKAEAIRVPSLLPEASAPQTAAQAFETLGKSIEEAVKTRRPVEAPAPVPVVAPPAPEPRIAPVIAKVPFVPDAIRSSLERTGKAIIVGREGDGLFATSQAAKLLGFDDVQGLFAQKAFWPALFDAGSGAAVSLVTATGETEAFDVTRARVPWLNGPADQFILQSFKKPDVKPPERPARPAPDPKPETPSPVSKAATPQVVEVAVVPAPLIPNLSPVLQPVAEVETLAPDAVSKPLEAEKAADATIASDELKAILDVASDGIITLDKEGTILSFSAGAEAIFGLTQAEVIERPLGDLLKQESRKIFRDYLAGLNGPGLASVFNDGREVVAATREGNSVPLFLTVSRLQSPKSRAAMCAVVRDITTWKRTEQELRDAKEEAENANRQKSDFLARISHELRTPLNAIMGFSEVMRSERFGEIKNEKYRAYANDIHESGGHLLALINDLLDLSKVEAGKLELNFTAESLADATDHAIKLLQEEARTARVLLRTAFPAKLPRVVADHRALRQIILNLLSNAVKYTNAGGQVVVSAHVETDGSLLLRVKDTGIGMTEDQLRDALQPFTRVETPDRARQGTGLGLPLTKALTEANRARLRMNSAPQQGTTAEVIFPGTRVLAE